MSTFDSNSELKKELAAQRSWELNTDGFQGCVECKHGFYLATYSKEGLCTSCEFIHFPQRFYPCPCCRRANSTSHTFLCTSCDWELFRLKDSMNCKYFKWEIHQAVTLWKQKLATTVGLGESKTLGKSWDKWLGFPVSANQWQKFNFLPEIDLKTGYCLSKPDSVWVSFVNLFCMDCKKSINEVPTLEWCTSCGQEAYCDSSKCKVAFQKHKLRCQKFTKVNTQCQAPTGLIFINKSMLNV